ncbi:MAG: type II toxin-antitoxin system death-on-curing family toxin [Gemmatimonadota bacterium]
MSRERPEPGWVGITAVRVLHADQIRQHGGAAGLRDRGLLESALAPPRDRWHYDAEADLPTLAAAYGAGVARNHPFVDGNKRTAFQTMYLFLGLNGFRIVADEPEVVKVMTEVGAGSVKEDELAEWLRTHTEAR